MKKRLMVVWLAFYGLTWAMNVIPEERGGIDLDVSPQCAAKLMLVDALLNMRTVGFPIETVKGMAAQKMEGQPLEAKIAVLKLVDVVYKQEFSADPTKAAIEKALFLQNAKQSIDQCRSVI